MSEANKELARQFFEEVWNKSRRGAIAELLAPNAVIYESGEVIRGPEGFQPFFDRMQVWTPSRPSRCLARTTRLFHSGRQPLHRVFCAGQAEKDRRQWRAGTVTVRRP